MCADRRNCTKLLSTTTIQCSLLDKNIFSSNTKAEQKQFKILHNYGPSNSDRHLLGL